MKNGIENFLMNQIKISASEVCSEITEQLARDGQGILGQPTWQKSTHSMASPENIHPEKENEPRGTKEVQKLPSIHRALNAGFIITESNQKEDKIYIIEVVKKRYET